MRAFNQLNLIPASTVMNATINSSPMQLLNVFCYAIQIVFTGTPTGAFKLQASNDASNLAVSQANYTGAQTAPVNWTDVADSTLSVVAAGNVMWTVENPAYNWVRVVYTDSSSGASTAIITSSTVNGKGF